jgi:hypothetical protein
MDLKDKDSWLEIQGVPTRVIQEQAVFSGTGQNYDDQISLNAKSHFTQS